VSANLPYLRQDLDFMPSPVSDRPGLLIKDPYSYSEAVLVIPPALVESLKLFDGNHGIPDLDGLLLRLTGQVDVSELRDHLLSTLSEAGFLYDDNFNHLFVEHQAKFRTAPVRQSKHAGSVYPSDRSELEGALSRCLNPVQRSPSPFAETVGIVAPDFGLNQPGWESFGTVYRRLDANVRPITVVILGVSHYGEPERFGLTKKSFVTPLGQADVDVSLVDWIFREVPEAIDMEDYCHSFEYTIELQILFLQYLLGREFQIVPILCGSFARSLYEGGIPEDDEPVERFLEVLRNLALREGRRLFWVATGTMSHMGRRYGDAASAKPRVGEMITVERRDRERISRILDQDRHGFWRMTQDRHDDLKWSCSGTVYALLAILAGVKGHLEDYVQTDVDEESVITFGGISFGR